MIMENSNFQRAFIIHGSCNVIWCNIILKILTRYIVRLQSIKEKMVIKQKRDRSSFLLIDVRNRLRVWKVQISLVNSMGCVVKRWSRDKFIYSFDFFIADSVRYCVYIHIYFLYLFKFFRWTFPMKYARRSTVEYNSINQANFFNAKIKIKWRFRNGYVYYFILQIFINFSGFYLHFAIIQRVSPKCWKYILHA